MSARFSAAPVAPKQRLALVLEFRDKLASCWLSSVMEDIPHIPFLWHVVLCSSVVLFLRF